jgi:hypothetical protein
MVETVAEHARRLKGEAHAGPVGKRQSSFVLYNLLSGCMALAKRAQTNAVEALELRDLVRDEQTSGKGRWTLKSSDVYTVVCRYVFPRTGDARRELSNASRYAHALREAAKREIAPEELTEWLSTKGGVNALFLTRPDLRSTVLTKTLYLSEQIEVKKDVAFTLKLRRLPNNVYEVLKD